MNLEKALPSREWAAVEAWLTTFYRYQLEWLLDWSRFSLLNKSRQIGASHTIGGAGTVLWGLLGETSTIVSIGEREAVEVLDKVGKHATALARMGSRWAVPSITATTVKLASGGRVLALPSTSGGRSFSGNVVLDELAYHAHPEKVWDGAAGTVMHGYKLRGMSTPNGIGNFWHQLWANPKSHAGYRMHQVTLEQARADGLVVDDAECWRMARGQDRVYRQLFCGSFIDGDAQYIPSELLERAKVDDVYCYDGENFAGLDIGRTADLTALVIARRDAAGVFWVQKVDTRKRTSQEDLDNLAALAINTYGVRRLCIDATGMGAYPSEAIQKRYGRSRVELVPFTMQSKEDMATTLYQTFADERLKILATEEKLRDDVQSLRRIITAAGNVRYDAPHTDEGHADRAWALALAIHAGTGPDRRRHETGPRTTTEEDYPEPI